MSCVMVAFILNIEAIFMRINEGIVILLTTIIISGEYGGFQKFLNKNFTEFILNIQKGLDQ